MDSFPITSMGQWSGPRSICPVASPVIEMFGDDGEETLSRFDIMDFLPVKPRSLSSWVEHKTLG